jgi:hypothetical protein
MAREMNGSFYHPDHEEINWKYATEGLVGGLRGARKGVNSNSSGFTGKEFTEVADIVALGCSYTYGEGVLPGQTWADFVAKDLNLSMHNLGSSGKGVPFEINCFFEYVKKFGNPKIVLCLFPDFVRMEISSRSHQMRPQKEYRINGSVPSLDQDEEVITYGICPQPTYEGRPKYLKTAVVAEEIMPLETAQMLSIQYIKMLEAYCNTNNIKLIWTTWVVGQNIWLNQNKDKGYFRNYFNFNETEWHQRVEDLGKDILCSKFHRKGAACSTEFLCHSEQREEYPSAFDIALDVKISRTATLNGHSSIHKHIHWAEFFVKEINDYNIGS